MREGLPWEMLYADDLLLVGKYEEELKEKLRKWNECFKDKDVVLCHTLPIFTGLGQCPIINWDFVGAVSIFGLDALPVIHQ